MADNSVRHLRNRHGSDNIAGTTAAAAAATISDGSTYASSASHQGRAERRAYSLDLRSIDDDDASILYSSAAPLLSDEPSAAPVLQSSGNAFPPRTSSLRTAAVNGSLPAIMESSMSSSSRERLAPASGPSGAVVATWSNLPNKGQLAILALSRFVDFFQMAALQTFMVHQLKSFDPALSEMTIAHQAGVLQGSFTAAQIITSILWGRAADHPAVGRKTVLLIGLIGTGFGCMGVGFSSSYEQAVVWRLLSGAVNGTVGSARTMVAECTPKPWHPRAFLLLPAAFNVANVAGPILAGWLVDPYVNLPAYFGPDSLFGGAQGVQWTKRHPYAAANLLSTCLLFLEALLVHFALRETLRTKRPLALASINPVRILRNIRLRLSRARSKAYKSLLDRQQRGGLLDPRDSIELDERPFKGEYESSSRRPAAPVLPFRRIWTSNVLWTLLSIAIFDFHMGAFANLWVLFLATPRSSSPVRLGGGAATARSETSTPITSATTATTANLITLRRDDAFRFSSGLGFPPAEIGYAMAILGFIGVALQFLLYPWANARFGLMRCFRGSLVLFPLAYALAPYLALLPSSSSSSSASPASGPLVWAGISAVLFCQVAARTFALPASIILMNNAAPHPSVLGTVHGIANAVAATARTAGPVLAASWFGVWTARGIIGMAWWLVALVAAAGCAASFALRNGSGHEIVLPGDEAERKDGGGGPAGSGSGDGR